MIARIVTSASVVLFASTAGAASPVLAQSDGSTAVRGLVLDANGAPLGDFPLVVSDPNGRSVQLRTSRDGRFQTIGLGAGVVAVSADAQGYAPLTVRCRIPSGQTAFVELLGTRALRPAQFAGHCRIEPSTSDLYIID
ncbi:MAG: carboxypeptidase regulatory-like domain-containing protein [Candidatus Eremiobacteraeota bacterium]|nr:carboxypeptidase regulatory-like domain-containing protein [Candidatus Eremiobacteraeota bacterium]MBC5802766.1 carboxypeptidase regulatory-like domain-containing protein [Candidatus Eremiobacteraeota bacterium]MBC5820885.1 carboxypeptidase regulatory-like domain-containing protein [Candidatus Eremiobacteraeota bacterium]